MEDLKRRTVRFSIRIIRLCTALPSNREADVVARQLVKAGTSPGAHFREGLRARSKAEYVAKMNGGLMELEEALYWLEIVEEAGYMSEQQIGPLKAETDELTAILVSLINKWRRK